MSPTVVVLGPPGALTVETARELGRRLGEPVRDTDEAVAAAAGKPVAEIFVDDGEAAFRELERAAVAAALQADGVVVVGSGAVMDPLTEHALAGHVVAFLDASVADAARRLGLSRERPVAIGNPRAQWLRLMERRRPVYERAATFTVSTDGLEPPAVAGAVLARLETLPRHPDGHREGPATGGRDGDARGDRPRDRPA